MASVNQGNLGKILECAICLDTFDDPKMLQCQHNYCKTCLEPLVTKDGRLQKVNCPECRKVTKLPRGGVADLPSNFLINNLLSVNTDTRSNTIPHCDRHQEDLLELYCQVCDEPICHACKEIDHRGHSYKFVTDAFPCEKRKVINLVREAKPKISALKAKATALEREEEKVRDNALVVSQEIDSLVDALINKHTVLLEQKRQSLKQDLSDATLVQMAKLREQKESLFVTLDKVEVAEQILHSVDKVEFLRSKNEITSNLTELQSVAEQFKHCEKVVYKLDRKTTVEEVKVEEIGKVNSRGECSLSMRGGEPGVLYTGRALQTYEFIIARSTVQALGHLQNVFDNFKVLIFDSSRNIAFFLSIENNPDGTYSFYYQPPCSGIHKISVRSESVCGGEIHGSPFSWNVSPALYLRSFDLIDWLVDFRFRDYTYLSDCLLESGQHTWKIRMIRPPDVHYLDQKVGVVHPLRRSVWCWCNGNRLAAVQDSVPSSIKSVQHRDVLVVFLNLDKKQMIIYNERTKEKDIWRDIELPVTPFLFPDAFLSCVHFNVNRF